ncbi:putative RDD family membrane protein YckC [Motilibacter peucedani]|uniref:Putative RDD family membrane protein YckC n=1 Tax=Motilibacter peucedani TaxID=598650 RepID=A0A420XMR1_9ACTN|nr:putative RDD family membrane protein YckC [Motilibacter peucedani]
MTGEAVALDLRTASFVSRSLALLLDLAVQFAALYAIFLAVTLGLGAFDSAVVAGLTVVGVVGVLIGYPVVFETLTRGRSLGKLAFGLRVVRDDGGPERFRHALVRALVGFGELYLTSGSAALIASMVSERGKRLGDQLAGTVVVRERVPSLSRPVPLVAPGLAQWAGALELSALPDGLALEARTFLSRAPLLHDGSRARLAGQLASAVAARVTPPPPPGLPAEPYLATVLAERRRRELARVTPTYVPVPAPPPAAYAPVQHAPVGYAPAPYPAAVPQTGGSASTGSGFAPPV